MIVVNLNKAHKKIAENRTKYEVLKEVEQKLIPLLRAAMSAACLIVLHDEYGFGNKRLTKVLGRLNLQFEAIYDEDVTIDDIIKLVKDEVGIDLK